MKRSHPLAFFLLAAALIGGCGQKSKKNQAEENPAEDGKQNRNGSSTAVETENTDLKKPDAPAQGAPSAPVSPLKISYPFAINGNTNPFLAGAISSAVIAYPESIDTAENNSPVQVVPMGSSCLEAGQILSFQVEGKVAYSTLPEHMSEADGLPSTIVRHSLGSLNELSDIQGPINSLVAVFLDSSPPSARAQAPQSLDFSEAAAREFKYLTPKIGQIFFIGNGKDSTGASQSFIVPKGASRLYLAALDEFDWNNNQGRYSGVISCRKI